MKAELKEEINHLRLLTTNVIDEIKKWRDDLGRIEEKAIYLSDDQENYLIKILNDNKFIFTSQLSNFINFGDKNDPFLLAPLKKAEGKEKSEFLQIVSIEKDVSYYQRYMDYLAS